MIAKEEKVVYNRDLNLNKQGKVLEQIENVVGLPTSMVKHNEYYREYEIMLEKN